MKNLRKNSAGITLVALVITIIILIILASISIGAISGEHGIIKQAKEAKNLHEDAVSKEEKDIQELVNEYEKSLEENFIPSGKIGLEVSIKNPKNEYKVGETIYYTITISNNINTKIEDVCAEIVLNGVSDNVTIIDAGANSQDTGNKVMIDFIGLGEKRTIQCEYVVSRENAGVSAFMRVEVSAAPIIYGEENKIFKIGTVTSETATVTVEPLYTLTIHYVYASGTTAAPTVVGTYLEGEVFSYSSPVIDGYTPSYNFFHSDADGMPANDVEFTVVYTAAPSSS